jgi:hypothetical protein
LWSHKGPTLKGIRNWAPQVCNFFSWSKVEYFLDRVVQQGTHSNSIISGSCFQWYLKELYYVLIWITL